MTVVISCDCPFIEGVQSWQNQFPTCSDVQYLNIVHVGGIGNYVVYGALLVAIRLMVSPCELISTPEHHQVFLLCYS